MNDNFARRFNALFAASILLVLPACQEQVVSTAPTNLQPPAGPRLIEDSEHFYYGSDGMYHWDGQPPAGDLGTAEILSAKAGGYAPRPGTGGWVAGDVTFIGDQYKIDLDYTVNHDGSLFQTGHPSSGWSWTGIPYSRQASTGRLEKSLFLDMCGYLNRPGIVGDSQS